MNEHYGEEWRPWPGGCECHGEGRGYFSDYRTLFARCFATVEGRYFLLAWEDDAGFWLWKYGTFSWTPDGDIFSQYGPTGMNATRSRAEADCRRAVEGFSARVRARQ